MRVIAPGTVSLLAAFSLTACSKAPSGPAGSALTPPVSTSACGQFSADPDAERPEGSLRAFYPAAIHHELTGDTELSFDTESLVDVCEIFGGTYPQGTYFLTASAGRLDITLEDGSLLTWSADLAPGVYEGPGTYVLDDEEAPEIAEVSGIRSAAYFRITGPSAGEATVLEYRELLEPCTLVIAPEAATGSVTCPKLGVEGDPSRTVSWTWTWERLPASEASRFPSVTASST